MTIKKFTLLVIPFSVLLSCTNKLFNYALEKKGFYEEKIFIKKYI